MDLKTSLLVNRQLPEFVREEYPLFVSFLEAYYEFLETEKFTNNESQQNNLIEKLKDLKYISDVDYSLDDFEEQFFNTFLSYLPKNTTVDTDFLIKNVLPLYQAKGNQKSFEFLFRLLFGEEITIEYPREKVLRASDGKWVVQSVLQMEPKIWSEYTSNGTQKIYNLPYEIDPSLIQITVDGIIVNNYFIRKELKKIYFNISPNLNSIIRVYYPDFFNVSIFNNRQIVGKSTNARTVIESVVKRNLQGLVFYEFLVDSKQTTGLFRNGEQIGIETIIDGDTIPFTLQSLSNVKEITVTNSGQSYNVGDIVPIEGACIEKAVAVIDSVASGNVQSIKVLNPGRGYIIPPMINLTSLGDGNATANSILRETVVNFPGKWISDRGFLSSDEIRLQGKEYYVDFSYVISSKIEFQKYKNVVKNLLNPVGLINYANFKIFDNINVQSDIITIDDFKRQLAGQVNVSANSIYVYGNQNVYFNIANTTGVLTEGSYILVNSEIRIVNSIINNTTITVSEPFEFSFNGEFATILVPDYNTLTTEYWRELAVRIDGPIPRTILITTEE